MTKTTRKTYGRLEISNGKIDVTDPCYEKGLKGLWCRMDDVKVVSGNYKCVVWKKDEGIFGERVSRIGIYLNEIPKRKEMRKIGGIGVDAGLAGFFIDKPDYTDGEWQEFCSNLDFDDNEGVWLRDKAFFSTSGYGDGCYAVYGRAMGNDYDALEIKFI